MTKQPEKLVDAVELADRLDTSPDAVLKLHRDGVLPAYRVGKRALRFDPAECLERLRVERLQPQGGAA